MTESLSLSRPSKIRTPQTGWGALLQLLQEPSALMQAAKMAGLSTEQLERCLRLERSRFWRAGWAPTPKQGLFLCPPVNRIEDVLFGGAAGGGKSEGLIAGGAQFLDVPGYSALLLRNTYQDLKLAGALMDRAFPWFQDSGGRWSAQDKTWYFRPMTGKPESRLAFGYMEAEKDKYRYRSAEYQYIGFDELTLFSEGMYRFMFSRLRRPEEGPLRMVPLRMRSGTNPGGPGHEWVRNRFIDPFFEGKLPDTRAFIASLLSDNPHIDKESYIQSLGELDPVELERLLRGDWTVTEQGTTFRRRWIMDCGGLIGPVDVPAKLRVCRFWDLAATRPKGTKSHDPDWSVGAKIGTDDDDFWYTMNVVRMRDSPGAVEQMILDTAELDGREVPVVWEEEGGASGKWTSADLVKKLTARGFTGRGVPPEGNKAVRARPVATAWKAEIWRVLRGSWNGPYFDEFEAFGGAAAHDDQVDATSGGYAFLAYGSRTKHVPIAHGLDILGSF